MSGYRFKKDFKKNKSLKRDLRVGGRRRNWRRLRWIFLDMCRSRYSIFFGWRLFMKCFFCKRWIFSHKGRFSGIKRVKGCQLFFRNYTSGKHYFGVLRGNRGGRRGAYIFRLRRFYGLVGFGLLRNIWSNFYFYLMRYRVFMVRRCIKKKKRARRWIAPYIWYLRAWRLYRAVMKRRLFLFGLFNSCVVPNRLRLLTIVDIIPGINSWVCAPIYYFSFFSCFIFKLANYFNFMMFRVVLISCFLFKAKNMILFGENMFKECSNAKYFWGFFRRYPTYFNRRRKFQLRRKARGFFRGWYVRKVVRRRWRRRRLRTNMFFINYAKQLKFFLGYFFKRFFRYRRFFWFRYTRHKRKWRNRVGLVYARGIINKYLLVWDFFKNDDIGVARINDIYFKYFMIRYYFQFLFNLYVFAWSRYLEVSILLDKFRGRICDVDISLYVRVKLNNLYVTVVRNGKVCGVYSVAMIVVRGVRLCPNMHARRQMRSHAYFLGRLIGRVLLKLQLRQFQLSIIVRGLIFRSRGVLTGLFHGISKLTGSRWGRRTRVGRKWVYVRGKGWRFWRIWRRWPEWVVRRIRWRRRYNRIAHIVRAVRPFRIKRCIFRVLRSFNGVRARKVPC